MKPVQRSLLEALSLCRSAESSELAERYEALAGHQIGPGTLFVNMRKIVERGEATHSDTRDESGNPIRVFQIAWVGLDRLSGATDVVHCRPGITCPVCGSHRRRDMLRKAGTTGHLCLDCGQGYRTTVRTEKEAQGDG